MQLTVRERQYPRYGFVAAKIDVKSEAGDTIAASSNAIANICEGGMCFEATLATGTPPNKGDSVSVTFTPYSDSGRLKVAAMTISKATVIWNKPSDPSGGTTWLMGVEVSRASVDGLVIDWIRILGLAKEPISPEPTNTGPVDAVPASEGRWDRFFLGLNIFGVGCGMVALLWPKGSVRDTVLLLFMVATTAVYGLRHVWPQLYHWMRRSP